MVAARGVPKTNQGQGEVCTQPTGIRAEIVVIMQRGERKECIERPAEEERGDFSVAKQVGCEASIVVNGSGVWRSSR